MGKKFLHSLRVAIRTSDADIITISVSEEVKYCTRRCNEWEFSFSRLPEGIAFFERKLEKKFPGLEYTIKMKPQNKIGVSLIVSGLVEYRIQQKAQAAQKKSRRQGKALLQKRREKEKKVTRRKNKVFGSSWGSRWFTQRLFRL